MITDDGGLGYTRYEAILKKWENGRVPDDGEPDEIIYSVHYTDIWGNEVTNVNIINDLEERYKRSLNH
jgi:hypothetical protein